MKKKKWRKYWTNWFKNKKHWVSGRRNQNKMQNGKVFNLFAFLCVFGSLLYVWQFFQLLDFTIALHGRWCCCYRCSCSIVKLNLYPKCTFSIFVEKKMIYCNQFCVDRHKWKHQYHVFHVTKVNRPHTSRREKTLSSLLLPSMTTK